MVSYQTFTKLVFEEARRNGFRVEGIADGGSLVQDVVSPLWNRDKAEIKGFTKAQARNYINREVDWT